MNKKIITPFDPEYVSQLAPLKDVKVVRSVPAQPINNYWKHLGTNEEGKQFRIKRTSI